MCADYDTFSDKEDEWIEQFKSYKTHLYKTYVLRDDNDLSGVGDVVYQYLSTMITASVKMSVIDENTRIIRCKSSVLSTIVGLKLKIMVKLIQNGDRLMVCYKSSFNEIIELLEASESLLGGDAISYAKKALGVYVRMRIPFDLNKIIKQYLNKEKLLITITREWEPLILVQCTEQVKQNFLLAEQGNRVAQRKLGNSLANAEGIRRSDEKAAEYYLKAAHQGDIEAQERISICYRKGIGVEEDLVKAVKWEKMALDGRKKIQQMNKRKEERIKEKTEFIQDKESSWLDKILNKIETISILPTEIEQKEKIRY